MSSLTELLKGATGGHGLAQLGAQFGLDAAQTERLTDLIAPTLGKATAIRAQGGADESVLKAAEGEAQARLLDAPEAAAQPDARAEGERFLSEILGGDAQHALAARAAEQTSAPPDAVSQFMPALAALMQGAMQKQVPDTEIAAQRDSSAGLASLLGGSGGGGILGGVMSALTGGGGGQQGGLGGLMSMLDADKDGNALDDVLEMVRRR
ncbi:DUF937 domain-containing protein [Pontivivens ytuae]|uniref:DUF937 domain-containing protein n=1 Tax=Pontivivens ytuae TaxID=2789856 RepID=A0A7S9LU64_9RHOB|nr:DUF937 domain-containing protein [Pontivivens ytuae]QPH55189.1 hypothetical protein I0K15_05470 [Pontivivens ytuae]